MANKNVVRLGAIKNLPIVISRSVIRKCERVLRNLAGFCLLDSDTIPTNFVRGYLSEKAFIHGMKKWTVGSEKRGLVCYHNASFHPPLQLDRQGNTFQGNQYSSEDVIGSAAYHLEMLSALFLNLKEKKLWDESLVIIVGDHGFRFGNGGLKDDAFAAYPELPKKLPSGADPSAYHPAFLIKFPHQHHSLELSNIPIALSDIRGLIAQYVNEDDWTNIKSNVFEIPLDRENEIYRGERITFRGGADAIPAAIEKYEREQKSDSDFL